MVPLSHCLLNQNVRYLGGAQRSSGRWWTSTSTGVSDPADALPGGAGLGWLNRAMLIAYGAGGTVRAPDPPAPGSVYRIRPAAICHSRPGPLSETCPTIGSRASTRSESWVWPAPVVRGADDSGSGRRGRYPDPLPPGRIGPPNAEPGRGRGPRRTRARSIHPRLVSPAHPDRSAGAVHQARPERELSNLIAGMPSALVTHSAGRLRDRGRVRAR